MAKVLMVSNGVKFQVIEGTPEECQEFCEAYNWELVDENQFVWDLVIDD